MNADQKVQDEKGEAPVKRNFFSIDMKASSFKMKENFNFFSKIVNDFRKVERHPVLSRSEALTAWKIDGEDEKAIETESKKAERASTLFLLSFIMIAIFTAINCKLSDFSLLSAINSGLALASCLSLTFVKSWQASVIKGEFYTFSDYMKKFRWIFSVAAVIFYAASVQFVQAAGMVDLPDLEVKLGTDLSNRLVGQLIGAPWGEHGGTALASGVSSVLVPLMQALNTGALMFVSIFCVYIYTFGIVQIAHSGNWGDSQIFSTFWSPVRTTTALALCAPVASGISTIQHIVLIAIAMSINFANNVTAIVTEQIVENNGLTISATMGPVVEENFGKITNAIIKSMTIQHAATGIFGINLSAQQYYKVTVKEHAGQKVATIAFTAPQRVSSGTMPSITITAPSENVLNGYVSAIAGVTDALSPVFSTVLSDDVSKRGDVSGLDDALKAAHKSFSETLKNAYTAQINSHNADSDVKQTLQNMSQQTGALGWMTVGIYPFVVARAQAQAQSLVSATIETDEGNFDLALSDISSVRTSETSLVASLFKAIDSKMKNLIASGAYAGMSSIGHTRTNGVGIKALWDMAADYIDAIAPSFIVKSLKESNPVAAMYGFGSSMIDISSVLITAWGGIAGGAEGAAKSGNNASGFLGQVPFVGAAIDTAAGGMKGALAGSITIWTAVVVPLLSIVFLFGISCCYVLPAIPVVFWARALVSWAVLVVETLVGAPFWAAAHVLPEGQGMAGQHARQGYVLLLDVFLRPVLLVVGAVMSILLVQIFGAILAEILGLWATITNQSANYIFAGIVFTSGMMIFITYESIKALYLRGMELPEKVIKWCGNNLFGASQGGSQGSANISQASVTTQKIVTGGMAGAVNKGASIAQQAEKMNLNKGK